MTYEEWHALIIKQLNRVLAMKPRGTLARVQREMGVNERYIQQWRVGKKIPVNRLLEMLEKLDEDPAAFFVHAFLPIVKEGPAKRETPRGPAWRRFREIEANEHNS